MTRPWKFRAALIATPLVAFVLYAALNWYEIEEKTVRTGLSEAAIEDPYLAFSRLLQRMGTQAEFTRSPARLASPPEGGVLVLGRRRLAFMTPTRLRELDAWVHRGGTLVAQAELGGIDDPLLERYGLERDLPREPFRKRDAPRKAPAEKTVKKGPPSFVASIPWPGAARPLKVRLFGTGLRPIGEADPPDIFTVMLGERMMLAAFSVDRGRVIFLEDLTFLGNRAIADFDHAEFAWRLVAGTPERKPVMLFLRVDSPSLWDWMIEHAWPVLAGATALLLLWLGRIVPRFGPLEPEPVPARRSLGEHLRAAGRYVWSRGAAPTLIDAVRERTWRTAMRRRGGVKGLAHSKAQSTLAEVSGRPLATVQRAMQGPSATPAAFVATAAALQEIEAGLAHRTRTSSRPKKEKTP